MALVTTKEMFRKAYEGKYAIGAFNVDNIDIMQGVLAGAQKVQAPVMVAFSEGALKFIHPAYVRAAAEAAAQELDIPFAIHLDHGKTVELCKKCVDNGFTSVMIDASSYDFETNIAMTKEVVEYAHARGVVVESELGAIAGIEDDVVVADKYGQFTHPDDAVEFVERTGIDSLAIAIGTAHGAYKFKPGQKPQLRFDILEETRLPPGAPRRFLRPPRPAGDLQHLWWPDARGHRHPHGHAAPGVHHGRVQDQRGHGHPGVLLRRDPPADGPEPHQVRRPHLPGAGAHGGGGDGGQAHH